MNSAMVKISFNKDLNQGKILTALAALVEKKQGNLKISEVSFSSGEIYGELHLSSEIKSMPEYCKVTGNIQDEFAIILN